VVDCEYGLLSISVTSTIGRTENNITTRTASKKEKSLLDTVWRPSTYDEKKKQNVVLRDVLVHELIDSGGLTLIEANEKLRYLEDSCKLFLIEDSFFVAYTLEKPTSTADKRREQLQRSWLRVDERQSICVTLAEAREIESSAVLLPDDEFFEKRSRKRWTAIRKKHSLHFVEQQKKEEEEEEVF
jgi:hypothetical protein